jgi:ribosomal protein L29
VSNKRIQKFKELSNDELVSQIRDGEKALFETKFRLVTGQLANTSSIWLQRKDLARMKMLLGQKQKQERQTQNA